MENYDLIVIGTGSAMNYMNPIINSSPKIKIAVIDKDEPGGISLYQRVHPFKNPALSCRTYQGTENRAAFWNQA